MSSLDNSPFKKYDKIYWTKLSGYRQTKKKKSVSVVQRKTIMEGVIVDGYYQEECKTRREGWRYLIRHDNPIGDTHIEKYSFEIKRC